MKLAESRGSLRRNLGGADAVWTDEVLDGAVARAVEDLDRIVPQEKMGGFTIILSVDGEVWDSGTLGTVITLANKRIRPKGEKVTNAADTTTYVRDTDYTMDYAAGKITTITAANGGSIPDSQADLLITYNILEVYLDISSFTDLIRVVRIEYPAGQVPGEFQPFSTWGDFAVITARGRQSQQRMAEKEHAWLYYHAKHTIPQVNVEGSWKPQLDEVVIKGAEGYSLMTKALELRHDAGTRLTSSLTILGQVTAIEVKINTALTNTATQATSASADLDNIQARIDDMLATLASAGGYLASAGASIVSALSQASQAESDIGAIDSPLIKATGKLATVDSLVTNVSSLMDNVSTLVSTAQAPLSSASADLFTTLGLLRSSVDKLGAVEGARLESRDKLEKSSTREATADDKLLDDVTGKLAAMQTGLSDLIEGVGDQITLAKSQLNTGEDNINQVNIGEQVSEMYRRYAETYLVAGRLRYDEHLTFLGRIDRVLAQGTALLAGAAEVRAQADSWVNNGNLAISQINALLGKIRGYQENVAQYISLAQSRINSGQVISNAATAGVGLVGRGIEQANSYTAIARLRLDAASESSDLVQSYIAAAAQYIGMAEAKIAEGNAKRTPIDAILERVTRKIEIARVFQQESDRRLQEIALKQQETDRYLALAVQESELADKFEERGVLTKVEFMDILTDRAQVRADTSLSPTRSQATS